MESNTSGKINSRKQREEEGRIQMFIGLLTESEVCPDVTALMQVMCGEAVAYRRLPSASILLSQLSLCVSSSVFPLGRWR